MLTAQADVPLAFRSAVDRAGGSAVGALRASLFGKPPQTVLMAGFTPHPVWCRFTLLPPPGTSARHPAAYVLQLTNWHLDEANLYVPDTAGGYAVQRAGDQVPFASRAIPSRFPTFRLLLTSAQPTTCFVQVRSTQHLNLTLRLSTAAAFSEAALNSDHTYFTLGLTVMRLMLHLALLLLLRQDRHFRAYSLWGMSVCLSYLFARGNGNVLFPQSPYWANVVFFLAGSLMPFTMAYFVGTLYDVPTHFRRLVRVGWGIAAICVASLVANLVGPHTYLTQAMVVFFGAVVVGLLGLAGVGYRRGIRPSGWYLVPLLIYVIPYTVVYVRNLLTYGRMASLIGGSLQETSIQWAFLAEFLFAPFLAVVMFRQTPPQTPDALPDSPLAEADMTPPTEPTELAAVPELTDPPVVNTPPAPPRPARTRLQQAFLDKVQAEVANQLGDSAFDVERLAEAVAVSSRTLNRRLTMQLGVSAGELIRTARLERAAHLLGEGLSPMETAYQVGFENPSSFSRAFREHYGVAPSAYAASVESGSQPDSTGSPTQQKTTQRPQGK